MPISQASCFSRGRLSHWVVLAACGAIFSGALLLSPVSPASSHLTLFTWELPSTCSFHNLTGLPCPGCGLSRSIVAAVHGDLAGSWEYHRLGALTLFYIVLQLLFRIGMLGAPAVTMRLLGSGVWLNRGLIVLAVLYGINWAITLALLL
jgi:hypothetical protein